jgi:hypothetical protein
MVFKMKTKLLIFAVLSVFLPSSAFAATLNFSPPSGTHAVGTTFSINVYVESADQAMNAASGVVSFPWDKLEVVSISKQGSVFSLWPMEPSFSNSAGTVHFEGIALNPGFTGANGKILTITFRARSAGQANMSFSSGSVLANDGTGTNILNGLRVAAFTLTSAGETPSAPKIEAPTATGNVLDIASPTHPDQTKWYTDTTPEFFWNLPSGALEVRTLIGKSPTGNPSVSYIPPISKKKVDELPDGTYYFALRVRTADGWSAVSRYRVNIDTTPPRPFSITFPHGDKGWEPQPVVFFNTTDGGSGISHYDIKIGNGAKQTRSTPTASNPYVLPPQVPGTYELLVTAVDNAGNVRNSSAEFTIKAIDSPRITSYPETLEEGDILKVRGTTYQTSEITLYIREGDTLVSEEYAKSNADGDFAVVASKKLDPGVYTITARVTDDRGARSNETSPLTISIQSNSVSGLINSILKYLSTAILIVVAVGSIAVLIAYLWFKILRVVRHMKQEAHEAERVSEKAFRLMRKDIETHIMRLKGVKRKLTAEEMAFLEQFERELGEAEEVIAKEIRDISGDR